MTMCSTVQWSAGDVRCARQIATLIIAIITDCDMCLFICCDCRRNNNNNNNDIYKQRSWAALSKIRRAAGTCHSVLTKRCTFRRRAKVAVDWTMSTDAVQLVNCSKSQDRKQQSSCDQWLWPDRCTSSLPEAADRRCRRPVR